MRRVMYSLVSCIGCFIYCLMIVRCRTCFFPFSFPFFSNCHISIDNWQTALRKQYNKRDPQANPLGPEPKISTLSNQEDIIQLVEGEASSLVVDTPALTSCSTPYTGGFDDRDAKLARPHQKLDKNDSYSSEKDTSIDWLHLPMLSKLDSMHALIEWQFQNPARLRNIMKSDDESALWVRSISFFHPPKLIPTEIAHRTCRLR